MWGSDFVCVDIPALPRACSGDKILLNIGAIVPADAEFRVRDFGSIPFL